MSNDEPSRFLTCEECDNTTGEFICRNCPGYLCSNCKIEHHRRKITSHHVIAPVTGKQVARLKRRLVDRPKQRACFETDLEYQLGVRILSDSKILIFGNDPCIRVSDAKGNRHVPINTDTEVSPDGMALLPDDGILYSDVETKRVLHVTLDGVSRTLIATDWSPTGLCATQSGSILVGLFHQDSHFHAEQMGKVEEYSVSGSKVREISGEERPFYSRPEHITENFNRDIIVSDYNLKKIIAVNVKGQFRFSYSGISKNKSCQFLPMEIDTDTVGHVIIADQFRHSIHVIDKDGAFVRLLLTEEHGIKAPHGLCFDGIDSIWIAELESQKVKKFKILSSK